MEPLNDEPSTWAKVLGWVSPDGKKTIGAINERWQKREENKRGVGPRRGDRAGVVWPAKPQNE